MHHSEVKLEKDGIDTTVRRILNGLPGDTMSALDTLQKAIYHVCSLRDIEFLMLINGQGFELGEAHLLFVDFKPADPRYNIIKF